MKIYQFVEANFAQLYGIRLVRVYVRYIAFVVVDFNEEIVRP